MIAAEIGAGICLPDSKKYNIKITINDFTMETDKPVETKKNYCRWTKRFDPQEFEAVYTDIADLDMIYVYLMDGSKPVCYWKGKATDFKDPNPKL